ncbi:hypothetical protein [Ilumatobacter sp.]|uniref:hypothetical protein n=1 Tax=Ilumatobacter sp. TaxID=1967498 RepID=UPI003753A2EC
MTTTSQVRIPVSPPQVRPRLHGLTTTFLPRDLGTHDRLGVVWPGSGVCGGVVSTTDDECLSGDSQTALTLAESCLAGGTAERHTVYSYVRQSLFDTLGRDDAYTTSPDSVFAYSEAPAVEGIFWDEATGAATALPAASSLLSALAEVEQHLAEEYNGLGVIHLTPRAAIMLGGDGLVRPSGTLTTRTGTPVVIGAGYDGADGLTVLGTGAPVLFRAGTPQQVETNDGTHNSSTVLIQRTWLIGYDCVAVTSTHTPA